jgi:hypothetical protein
MKVLLLTVLFVGSVASRKRAISSGDILLSDDPPLAPPGDAECAEEPSAADQEFMQGLSGALKNSSCFGFFKTFFDRFVERDVESSSPDVTRKDALSDPWGNVPPQAIEDVYNPWGFCLLIGSIARKEAANTVGGQTRVKAQEFNEFNIDLWSDGKLRPINPATDHDLLNSGPMGRFGPTWASLRSAGLVSVLLPTLVKTDNNNRTTWFMQSAQAACWNPVPLAAGPMLFQYRQVEPAVVSPSQKRGYYTSTSPQHPDFFREDGPLFLDGDRHRTYRRLLETAGFARRYPINMGLARSIPSVSGCPDKATVAKYVGPLVMEGIWGQAPTEEVEAAMLTYNKYGAFAIFGSLIHSVLGPAGVAEKIKNSAATVATWAQTTVYSELFLQARDYLVPGNPHFTENNLLIEDLTVATLFAGLVGTTDMTEKCVRFQKRDERHHQLFKRDPERYLIELMRYDSAVTSVTELLQQNTTMNLEGRDIQLAAGTPVQLVLATANRDPAHWRSPDTFDPDRQDLRQTLSWNGRAADVEARNLESAPRHCPGFCLSLKVATAVCSAMVGSFEELHVAGKILKENGRVKCNNFGEHQEPPLWNP